MRFRSVYQEIIAEDRFSVEINNLLVDLFEHYYTKYLSSVIQQYYNLALIKTNNIDGFLQYALDTNTMLWRGTSPIIEFRVKSRETYIYIYRLQEFFYADNLFFYYIDDSLYITPDENKIITIKLTYSSQSKRVIEVPLNNKSYFVKDDNQPIGEFINFYTKYEKGGKIHYDFIKHTRNPHEFYNYVGDLEDVKDVYDILVTSTPGWGVHIYFSDRIIDNTGKKIIFIEYLNNIYKELRDETLIKLMKNVINKMKLVIVSKDNKEISDDKKLNAINVNSIFNIYFGTEAEGVGGITKSHTDAVRFNGIIRSHSDYYNMIRHSIRSMIHDIKFYHYIHNDISSNVNLPNISYAIVIIPEKNKNNTKFFYLQNIKKYFPRFFVPLTLYEAPDLTALDDNQDIVIDAAPSSVFVFKAYPAMIIIRYIIESSAKNVVINKLRLHLYYLYFMKVIDYIDPNDIFNYIYKEISLDNVYFLSISVVIDDEEIILFKYKKDNQSPDIYTYYSSQTESNTIKMIKYEEIFTELKQNNWNITIKKRQLKKYFVYIERITYLDLKG